jgi:hypothetical protein
MNKLITVCGKQIRVRGRLLRTASLEADKYLFLEDPDALLKELKVCGTRVDLFTFIQKLPDTTKKYPFPMEWDNLAALPVSTFDNWWNNQIGFKARNKAKQAQKKGVVIREVPFDLTLVEGIWRIYNECPVRQGTRFSHYGKDVETVYKEEATFLDTSVFIGAYVGETLIGFIKMVYDETRTQAGLMNICSMIRERDKAPTNALVSQAVRSCADRGISYLVYSNFAYGSKLRSTLSDFKERNGFTRIDVPRYYAPLTPLGAVAQRLGLQHRLSSRLPEPITAKLRELRESWYSRRFNSVKEAL